MAGELRHYGAFVRSKPCAACGTPFLIEGHHALYGTTYSPDEPIPAKSIPNARKGASQVAHDWFLIPLCMRKCHTPGIHKNAGFFQGWSGAAIETWEREQVAEMHRLYDAEFPNGDPAKAARASVTATPNRTTRKRTGAGWTVATIHSWLRREAPTRPAILDAQI